MEALPTSRRQPWVKWEIDDRGRVTTTQLVPSPNECGCYSNSDGSVSLYTLTPGGRVHLIRLVGYTFYNSTPSESSASESS
jgi:hypothetical protein